MEKKLVQVNPNYIALTLMLPKIGRKTTLKIFQNLKYKLTSYDDLYDHLVECRINFKTPEVNKNDFEKSIRTLESTSYENEKRSIKVISYFDDTFPQRFLKEDDSPVILYCKGDINLLNHKHSVGVIGTREPYEKAIQLGQKLARRFSERGFNIVSGLAVGCDTSGHVGALDANGKTTAVLAHGLQMVYPKENTKLADRIVEQGGLLLSEYSTGTPPTRNSFVERDRLQSYLSDLLVVIQTDIKGGTMHAVNTTIESGKKIATIYPDWGDFRNHPKSRGNDYLIYELGATALVTKEDIENLIEEFSPATPDTEIPYNKVELSDSIVTPFENVEINTERVDESVIQINEDNPVLQEEISNRSESSIIEKIAVDIDSLYTAISELRDKVESLQKWKTEATLEINQLKNAKAKKERVKKSTDNNQATLL